jgi:hypothetical protein
MQDGFTVCVQTRWQLGFNDPYFLSWVMVAIYLLTAILVFVVARLAPFPAVTRRRERVFWAAVGVVLILMAVNKQADLQTLMMAAASCVLLSQGWYDPNDLLKGLVMAVLVLSAIAGGTAVLWSLHTTLRRSATPLIGLGLMAAFIVFRAAETLGPPRGIAFGHWPDRILELSGPLLIFAAAFMLLATRQKHAK